MKTKRYTVNRDYPCGKLTVYVSTETPHKEAVDQMNQLLKEENLQLLKYDDKDIEIKELDREW